MSCFVGNDVRKLLKRKDSDASDRGFASSF